MVKPAVALHFQVGMNLLTYGITGVSPGLSLHCGLVPFSLQIGFDPKRQVNEHILGMFTKRKINFLAGIKDNLKSINLDFVEVKLEWLW